MAMFKKLFAILLCLFTLLPISVQAENLDQNISSTAIYIYDADHQQVLLNKNGEERMYPASLTKMMTALVVIEHIQNLQKEVIITEEMLDGLREANASVAGYVKNDTTTVNDLLYGLALPSGADACNALAITVAGSIDQFVNMMNEKAKQLQMNATHFTNPTGLHDDNHYSTAKDMAILTAQIRQNTTLSKVFSTHSYTTSPLASHPSGIDLTNSLFQTAINHQYDITNLIGGKTGYTGEAGRCVSFWADINQMHLIVVLLDAPSTIGSNILDAQNILKNLQIYHRFIPKQQDEVIQTITVHHAFKEEQLELKMDEPLQYDLQENQNYQIHYYIDQTIDSKSHSQTILIPYQLIIDNQIVQQTDLQIVIPQEENFFARIYKWFTELF